MSNKSNNNKENIMIWLIVVVTGVIAFIIGQSIGVRSRSILYILVALELIIYYGIKWIFNNLKK